MSTSLTTLLERAAWIAGVVTLVIGAFAIARRLAVRFTGWRPAELSLPNSPPPRSPGWFLRFCDTSSAEAREPLGQAQVACRLARCVESAVVWLIGLALVGAGLLNVWWYGVDLDVVPAAQQRQEFVVLTLLALTITGLALIGVVWRMGVSIVAIGVLLSAYFSLLDQGTISRRAADEADLAACPIEIRMEDGTVGADVWVNGVLLGQTPLTVTLADWTKLPKWLDAPTTGPDGREVDVTRTSRRSRWINCVVRPDRRWVTSAMPEGVYFLWVEIGGEPLVAAHASQANVSFDGVQWMSSPILILGQSPRWLAALDRLLDQARVRDYQIDSLDEWLAALNSFGEGGWRQAMRAAENEPSLSKMLDKLLRHEMGLTPADSLDQAAQDAAWVIFERLERQATEARDYQSESRIGRSLELLLPHLDPDRLARYAAGVVGELRWVPSPVSWMRSLRGAKDVDSQNEYQHFGLLAESVDVTHFRRRDQLARLSFLAHAVWRMDEVLDLKAGDEADDNAIERLVVPALLRRAFEHPEVRMLAARLGGSLEDRLYQRRFHVWKTRRPDLDIRFDPQVWRMTQEDHSEAARRWRREHAEDVLAFADKIGLDESWPLQSLAFLLSDADGTANSVAARYWPRLLERVAQKSWPPVKKLETLWKYLIRLEPFSTPEMYVAAWRTAGVDLFLANELRLNDTHIATHIAYDKRKAIITALTAEAETRLKQAQTDGSRLRVEELNEVLRQIIQLERSVFASAAQIALQQFAYLEDKESAFESLAEVMTRESPARPELLELLDSPDSKNRLLAGRVIRTHPAPHIRPLLNTLLSDGEADVKRLANETQNEWQQLATESPRTWKPK